MKAGRRSSSNGYTSLASSQTIPRLIEPKARQIEVEINAVVFFEFGGLPRIEDPYIVWDFSRETAEPRDSGTKRNSTRADGRAARI